MSRILKRHDAAHGPAIRPLNSVRNTMPATGVETAPAIDPELLMLREEHGRLRQLVERKEAELSSLRAQLDAVFRKGEAQGRQAGLSEAADQGAKTLAAVESGVERALAAFANALSGLERLAPELARRGLTAMLGDADNRPDLVAAIVQQQLKGLKGQSVIHIAVSAADFADDAALTGFGEALNAHGLEIYADKTLKSGDCRIRLTLGALEVGVDQQWERLDSLLDDMAQPVGTLHD